MPEVHANPVILALEDDPGKLRRIVYLAEELQLEVIACSTLEKAVGEVRRLVRTTRFIGIVTDLSLGGQSTDEGGSQTHDGWKLIKLAYDLDPSLDLIVYSAFAGETFPLPPFENVPRFTRITRDNINADKAEALLKKQLERMRERWDRSRNLVHDDITEKIYGQLKNTYAQSPLSILIIGETGTGKERLARAIHEASYNQGPLVTINCGALEPSLAFGELFGHVQGAYTDASSHALGKILEASGYRSGSSKDKDFRVWLEKENGPLKETDGMLVASNSATTLPGTLFLDELASIPQTVMPGLLRILDTKDIFPFGYHGLPIRAQCRIIAATNEVEKLISDGFRKDLLYRLSGVVMTLPPLRERQPTVITQFLKSKVWGQEGVPNLDVSDEAVNMVMQLYRDRADENAKVYQAGNFRSLRNLIQRAALLARAEGAAAINTAHIEEAIGHGEIHAFVGAVPDQQAHIREVFSNALQEHSEKARPDFGLDDLKELAVRSPVITAYAFLRCNLVPRMNGIKRGKYYELKEIETALATGYARGAWINSNLKPEHVIQAAFLYFGCPYEQFADKKLSEIVKIVQKDRASSLVANGSSRSQNNM